MDVSGINNAMVNSSISNAKAQVQDKKFQEVLQKAYTEKDKEKLKEECQKFEQIFLSMVLKEMRATIPKNDLVDSSFARETFQDMLDEQLTENASKGQGIGIADMLYKNLVKQMDSSYKISSGANTENESSKSLEKQE